MYKVNYQGATLNVRMIAPSEISKMGSNEVVIVNRIRINSKLVEFEIQNSGDSETITIMRKAIIEMKIKERKSLKPAMGAMMAVKDILKIFDNIENLPNNSFAEINV